MTIPHGRQVLLAGVALAAGLLIAPHTLRADTVPPNGGQVDWPGYNNDYGSQRFSPLHQITTKMWGR
jgi:glucose dehydrogenase